MLNSIASVVILVCAGLALVELSFGASPDSETVLRSSESVSGFASRSVREPVFAPIVVPDKTQLIRGEGFARYIEDAASAVIRRSIEQPGRLITIELRNRSLAFMGLPANQQNELIEQFGREAEASYESALASFLTQVLTQSRSRGVEAISVQGLPLESQRINSSASNARYQTLIDQLDALLIARSIILVNSSQDELRIIRRAFPNSFRESDGRPIIYRANHVWRMCVFNKDDLGDELPTPENESRSTPQPSFSDDGDLESSTGRANESRDGDGPAGGIGGGNTLSTGGVESASGGGGGGGGGGQSGHSGGGGSWDESSEYTDTDDPLMSTFSASQSSDEDNMGYAPQPGGSSGGSSSGESGGGEESSNGENSSMPDARGIYHSTSYEEAGPPELHPIAHELRMLRGNQCIYKGTGSGTTQEDWLTPATVEQLEERLANIGVYEDYDGYFGFNWEIWTKGVWDSEAVQETCTQIIANLREVLPNATIGWVGPPFTRREISPGVYERIGPDELLWAWPLLDVIIPQVYAGTTVFGYAQQSNATEAMEWSLLSGKPVMPMVSSHAITSYSPRPLMPAETLAQWTAHFHSESAHAVLLWVNRNRNPLMETWIEQLEAMRSAWDEAEENASQGN